MFSYDELKFQNMCTYTYVHIYLDLITNIFKNSFSFNWSWNAGEILRPVRYQYAAICSLWGRKMLKF